MKIRPLNNHLVIKRWPETDISESGLILPSSAREKPQLGTVLATGPGHWARIDRGSTRRMERRYSYSRKPIDISLGETVVFEKMVSTDFQVTINGKDYLILPYQKVYAAISGLSITN